MPIDFVFWRLKIDEEMNKSIIVIALLVMINVSQIDAEYCNGTTTLLFGGCSDKTIVSVD